MGWKSLRVVGNLVILKVSYVALAILPFATNFIDWLEVLGFTKTQLFCLYFSSLSLALANLLYDVFCPPIIKRFESANDLYRDMLSIKKVSRIVYPNDEFCGEYEHAVTAYDRANKAKVIVYGITFLLFFMALAMFSALIFLRTKNYFFALFPETL